MTIQVGLLEVTSCRTVCYADQSSYFSARSATLKSLFELKSFDSIEPRDITKYLTKIVFLLLILSNGTSREKTLSVS